MINIGNRGSREEGDEILRLKAADGEYQYRGRCRDQPATYVLCGEFLEDFKHRKREKKQGDIIKEVDLENSRSRK